MRAPNPPAAQFTMASPAKGLKVAGWGWTGISLAAFMAVWYVAALMAESRVLPGPVQVASVLWTALLHGDLAFQTGATLARVAVAFTVAMIVGAAIGVAMGRSPSTNRLLDGWLILFLNIPALVVIILCYVWFGLTEVAVVTAVAINKIPTVAVTLREGARALEADYFEMAQSFRLKRTEVLRHVVLPQLAPFVFAAARSGLALIWKIVLVVELLGRSSGIGFKLHLFFQLFDVASIFAYTIAFVLVVQLIELAIFQPLERRLTRWRR
jgi:NitT/TauT family transport system permease protein